MLLVLFLFSENNILSLNLEAFAFSLKTLECEFYFELPIAFKSKLIDTLFPCIGPLKLSYSLVFCYRCLAWLITTYSTR
jgi:hypothetical protein